MNGIITPLVAFGLAIGPGTGMPQSSPVPVLVELFSSEGCSSCPPADALLKRLLRDQPVPGVRIVAVSEHVDYWDDLGWRDPFSSHSFTQRQEAYARRLGSGGIYTPQLVVAGATHLVGSNERSARAAIAEAAAEPLGEVSARAVPSAAGVIEVEARWPNRVDADVVVALVRDHATSKVERGENAGRILEHVAIARSISVIGSGAGSFSSRVMLTGAAEADHAVVFVQERNGGPVHGVATVDLYR